MDLEKANALIKKNGAGWFLTKIGDEHLRKLEDGAEQLSAKQEVGEISESLNEFLVMAVYLWEKETGYGIAENELKDALIRFAIMIGCEANVRNGTLDRVNEGIDFLSDPDTSEMTYRISEKGKIDVEAKMRRS